jgi:hypothetical protein
MSKPIARVAFFVLVSLVLIAATSASVRGWLGTSSESAAVQSHAVNGLQTNLNHDRSAATELDSLQLSGDLYENPVDSSRKDGGCHSEKNVNPSDY